MEELEILVVEQVVNKSDEHLILGEVPDKYNDNTSDVALLNGYEMVHGALRM